MTENTGTFRPLEDDARRLFGPVALIVCGHNTAEQTRLLQILAQNGLGSLPMLFATATLADRTLRELATMPHATGQNETPGTTRAIVVAGVTEATLHHVMRAHREAGLAQALWAALTPANADWTLRFLLQELGREREALRLAMHQAAEAATGPHPAPG